MVPAAGSAYTYAYATLGELVAWIIGWDLLLEYAIGNTAVAISWAAYADALPSRPRRRPPAVARDGLSHRLPQSRAPGERRPTSSVSRSSSTRWPSASSPAITVVLVWGVRESARFNAAMVAVKFVVLAFFVVACARFVRPANWHAVRAQRVRRDGRGRGGRLLCVHWIRRGLDVRRGVQEPRAGHAHRHHRLARLVHRRLRRRGRGLRRPHAVLGGRCASTPRSAPKRSRSRCSTSRMPGWAVGVVALGSVVAQTAVLLVFQLGQPRILLAMARDGLLPPVFARVHPRFRTPHVATILTGALVAAVACVREHRRDGRPDQHRDALRVHLGVRRHHRPSRARA